MFTQPRDPNNKAKPAYKKYCSYCHRTNHSISACFKKQRDDEDKRDTYARSNFLKNLLYSIFLLPPMIKHRDTIQDQVTISLDIVVEVHLAMITKNPIILNIDNDLLPELATIMIELLLLHITPGLVMTIINEILAHIVHHIDLLIDHLTDVIHVPDINLDLTPEITTFKDTLLPIDHRPDLKIPDILDLAHILIQETRSKIFNHKLPLIQSTLKYTCTTHRNGNCINSYKLVLLFIYTCFSKSKPT